MERDEYGSYFSAAPKPATAFLAKMGHFSKGKQEDCKVGVWFIFRLERRPLKVVRPQGMSF